MSDTRGPLPDPRASLGPPTPRLPIPEARPPPISTVCSCGLPNCTRVTPHHHQGAPHPPGYSPEGAGYGLGIPIGGAPSVGHMDPALIYSMQGAAYGLKDNPEMLRSLPQLNGYYPYDPTSVYPYMNGYAGIDARRKNATKESTNTLKAWLFEHRKNPYPTKGEKIMLAILTRMTLTQVSTWFANARRRLKKENKMTWSSKDDDLDDEAASEHNSDVNERGDVSGSSNAAHAMNGSIGDDDDDVLSITSDKSDIDVEENSEDLHRVPPLLPHTLAGHAAAAHHSAAMYLRNQHAEYLSAIGQSAAAASKDSSAMDSGDKQEPPTRPLSPVSPCSSLKSERATPPPSPKDGHHTSSQSQTSSHSQTHHSTATIHHHPTVTSTATSPKSASESSPGKPKIWSIADVVSSKDNNNDVTNKSSSGSSTSHTGPTPIVTIGGVPARMDLMNGGIHPHGIPAMMLPGSDSPYGLTYYPYGVPHPAAAAAIMASHASLASRVHPYTRLPGGIHGPHHHHHLAGHRDFPMGIPRPSQPPQSSPLAGGQGIGPQLRSPVPETRRPVDMSRKQDTPHVEEVVTSCTPTAFTPVAQRQV